MGRMHVVGSDSACVHVHGRRGRTLFVGQAAQSGASFWRLLGHALVRSLVLVLLAVFLTSAWSQETEWYFTNVLAQIGLGYPFVFLLAYTRPRFQLSVAALILIGYWVFFARHALPGPDFDWQAVGVPSDWPHFTGFAAHWEKNANAAATFDRWFLNLFPRSEPFEFSAGGYQTLNFVPSVATMVFGLMTGEWLRTDRPYSEKIWRLIWAGGVGIISGAVLGLTGLCPIVKRIWTPSWTLFSAGCVAWLLAALVAIVDWKGYRRWTFPLIVAGVNPITLYCLWQLSGGFIRRSLTTHLGQEFFSRWGPDFVPMMERMSVLVVLWMIVAWMYRQRIFVRI